MYLTPNNVLVYSLNVKNVSYFFRQAFFDDCRSLRKDECCCLCCNNKFGFVDCQRVEMIREKCVLLLGNVDRISSCGVVKGRKICWKSNWRNDNDRLVAFTLVSSWLIS